MQIYIPNMKKERKKKYTSQWGLIFMMYIYTYVFINIYAKMYIQFEFMPFHIAISIIFTEAKLSAKSAKLKPTILKMCTPLFLSASSDSETDLII
jgi:hypothetical protein